MENRIFINSKPKKVDELKFLGETPDAKMVFLNPNVPTWEFLTPFLSVFLSMCDGTKTIQELSNLLMLDKGKNKANLEIVAGIINFFKKTNLIYDLTKSFCEVPDSPSLKRACLHLTKECNLYCKYCFANAGTPHSGELSTDEWLGLINDLDKMKVKEIWLLGGEPFLRKDIYEIAKECKRRSMRVSVVTNGTLFTEDMVTRVKDLFYNIQVSLDGLKESHEFVRGKGSFLRTVKGIDILLKHNINFVVCTTISRTNIDDLDDFVSFLVKKGVSSLHTTRLQCDGRGAVHKEKTVCFAEYFSTLLNVYEKWCNKIHFNQFPNVFELKKHQKTNCCGAGSASLEIDSRGQVYACYKVLDDNEYILGDIRTNSISDIYDYSLKVYKAFWSEVDNDLLCAKCDFRYICGGACLIERCKNKDYSNCDEIRKFYKWALINTRDGKIVGDCFNHT